MRQDFRWGMNGKLWKCPIQGSLICEWLCWEHMVWSVKGRKISVHYLKCFGVLETEVGGCQLSGAPPFISFTKSTRKRFSWRQRSQLGHSQLKRERWYQGWGTIEGTGLRHSSWKVPNGKNMLLNYIPHFMTKIICYSVIHCLRDFRDSGELSFKNVKCFLKKDVEKIT